MKLLVQGNELCLTLETEEVMLDLLEETGMSGCRPSDTPNDSNQKLNGASKGA